jgi:hypothetical protein
MRTFSLTDNRKCECQLYLSPVCDKFVPSVVIRRAAGLFILEGNMLGNHPIKRLWKLSEDQNAAALSSP